MPKNKPLKIVVDTNLWISFLISDRQRKLDSLLYLDRIQLLFSAELLSEINTTTSKPKLKKYFSKNAFEEMLLNLEPYLKIIEVKSNVTVCRDPKDNFLLSLSKDGKADYLLTGDNDLLDLKKYGNTRILTLTNFLQEIKH
jgi:putative PIN family toxin of toxin-antitoxin system